MHATQEGLWEDMATARYLLENLGFVINLEKSVFVPTQKLGFLGFVINTIDMILVLPDDKVDQISVQDFAGATTSLSTGPFSTDWQTYGINSGCLSCAPALSSPPTPQKSGSCEGK